MIAAGFALNAPQLIFNIIFSSTAITSPELWPSNFTSVGGTEIIFKSISLN